MRCLLLALLMTTPVAAQSADATIDRATNAWAKVKTARGTFEQTVTNSLTGGTATARGEFQEERPARIAIRFTQPVGDAIVADGKMVWVYLPSAAPGQVVRRPATDRAAVPVDFTGQFLDAPRSKYDITDKGASTVDGHAARVLELVSKKGATAPFSRATVWVDNDDGLIRQFEIVETSGVTRRIHLTTLKLNTPVDDGAFTFTIPKGAKVVDQP
jgi:outer membrane lipoprotein carrier protein